MDWLTDALGIKVERVEIGRPGGAPYYPVAESGKGVLHTTEGNSVDGAISTFRAKGFAPHFITGGGRIVQCRPLWAQASALHTGHSPFYCNSYAQVQIEQVGFSKASLYDLPDETRIPSLHLLAYFADVIPLVAGFPDALTDLHGEMPASNNPRRRSRRFFTGPEGWYHHMEVPDQETSWHWDCGALRRQKMLDDAAALIAPPPPPPHEPGGGFMADLTEEQQKEMFLTLHAAGAGLAFGMGLTGSGAITKAWRALGAYLKDQGYPKP